MLCYHCDQESECLLTTCDKWLCEDCWKDNVQECDCCGDNYYHTEMDSIAYLNYCSSCLESHFQCESCRRFTSNSERHDTLDHRILCDSCYDDVWCECSECGDETLKDSDYSWNASYFCPSCWDRIFFTCSECSGLFSREEDGVCEDDVWYCLDCQSETVEDVIQSYGYKPSPKFKGERGPYFGIELEVADYQDKIRSTRTQATYLNEKIKSFAYLKDDESIESCGHDGFEIVTHPISWDWIRSNPEALDPIFALKHIGFKSHQAESCGMHVHVCKKNMTSLQIYKLITFFESNEDFIFKISQRTRRQLDRWAAIKCRGCYESKTRLAKQKYGGYRAALNLGPERSKTIEFRLFNGTLRKETFFKNLEFVTALLEFTSAARFGLQEMTQEHFSSYVSDNRLRFKNLYEFMIKVFE